MQKNSVLSRIEDIWKKICIFDSKTALQTKTGIFDAKLKKVIRVRISDLKNYDILVFYQNTAIEI